MPSRVLCFRTVQGLHAECRLGLRSHLKAKLGTDPLPRSQFVDSLQVLHWLLGGGPEFLAGFLDRVWPQFYAMWAWQRASSKSSRKRESAYFCNITTEVTAHHCFVHWTRVIRSSPCGRGEE